MAPISRRRAIGIFAAAGLPTSLPAAAERPPARPITRGPKFHWFGYYDKLQFDPSCRYVLSNEVDFEHRSPRPDDEIRVGMVDTGDGDRWIELGRSRAWCWQQGCMLQWLPGSAEEVVWNDREDGRFVSRILNVRTRRRRTIPAPVYALAPNGNWAVRPSFSRLQDMRPGYGYAGIPDENRDIPAPDNDGIWRTDLASGREEMIFSLAEAARIPFELPEGAPRRGIENSLDLSRAKHWFNHLLVAPGGRRLVFLHRWRAPGDRGFLTRMFTIAPDGSDPYVLDPNGWTSHFIWRDEAHVLAWAWHPSHGAAFYLYTDGTRKATPVGLGVMSRNGHCTYLPGNRWILNDTYPDRQRRQHVYLYEVATGRKVPLGDFYSPPEYRGEWRCDTHPRFSPDGRKVSIDSPHGGGGRQLYLIDISRIVAGHGSSGEPQSPPPERREKKLLA